MNSIASKTKYETVKWPEEVLPANCSSNLQKVDPRSIDCSDVIPRDIQPSFTKGETSINKIWNKGRWIQVSGHSCVKILVKSTCTENIFGFTDTSSSQEMMLATFDECTTHIKLAGHPK